MTSALPEVQRHRKLNELMSINDRLPKKECEKRLKQWAWRFDAALDCFNCRMDYPIPKNKNGRWGVSQRPKAVNHIENLTVMFDLYSLKSLPSNHLPDHLIRDVPDAETQRQHDSWSTQWRLFKFPGKDSDCQDAEYYANDLGEHMIISFIKWGPIRVSTATGHNCIA